MNDNVKKCLEYINLEHPEILSLLYDLDLLPEQLEEGTKEFNMMIIITSHFMKLEERLKG